MPLRKNILITGASSGLGAGMAREFAKRGRNLALCARRTDRLEALKAELLRDAPSIKVAIRALDVNDYDQVFEVFRAFRDDLGNDSLVIGLVAATALAIAGLAIAQRTSQRESA